MDAAERLLWERYTQSGDADAHGYLFLLYAPWAKAIARSVYQRVHPAQMEFADFIQNSSVGLLEAMSRFDSNRGIDFKLYGKPRVRGAVFNGLRIFLSESSHRESPYSERLELFELDSSDDPLDDIIDSVVGLGIGYLLDLQGSGGPTAAVEGMSYAHACEMERALLTAVESLPERLRMIISAHYFHHVPFQDMAAQLGLTKGRVSQLHKNALSKMRECLGPTASDNM